MKFLENFQKRGFFHQCTDFNALDQLSGQGSLAFYIGFDCTAPSLHVGSLIQIMIMRLLQKHGHKPIVIIGGGTTKVGDPSGKDEARKLLTDQDIESNMNGIKAVLSKFITFGDGQNDAILTNNADWLNHLNYIDFLRDYGRHFSVNRMLSFDSVKLRLEREQHLSFLELNYMILQAYDFIELNKRHNCRLQIGGSDQWGNIINGVELSRRLGGDELYGLTSPLLTTASGAKMGKTASGAVWLTEDMLSVYDYYQYWRNTEDADVIRFLRLFTELDEEKIEELAKLTGSNINEAKKILAFEATKLCHGEDNALSAADTARKAFEDKAFGDGLPSINIDRSELSAGIAAFELLTRAGLCISAGEAKRLIRGNGARVNGFVVQSETHRISLTDLQENDTLIISSGKKNHVIIKVNT